MEKIVTHVHRAVAEPVRMNSRDQEAKSVLLDAGMA